MREDLTLHKVSRMDNSKENKKESCVALSPRTSRRSRIDRIQRGDITTVKAFKKSFDNDDLNGCIEEEDNNKSSSNVGRVADNQGSTNNSNAKVSISINIEASSPVAKSFRNPDLELPVSNPQALSHFYVPNARDNIPSPSTRRATRSTVEAPTIQDPNQVLSKRRANTSPIISSGAWPVRNSSEDTSSGGSTPTASPSLRRRTDIDITQTPAYKELYANNLRSYGYLLYKDAKKSHNVTDDAQTQIQKQMKRARRKKQNYLYSSSKILRRHTGIPTLLDDRGVQSADEASISSDEEGRLRSRSMVLPRRLTDLGVYNLTVDKEKSHVELEKRKTEAEKRKEYRSARMKSLDDIIDQVNDLILRKKHISKSTNDLSTVSQ